MKYLSFQKNDRTNCAVGIKKLLLVLLISLFLVPVAYAERVTLNLRNVDIRDAMMLISTQQKINILVSQDIEGEINVNLYDMDVVDAIFGIAESAGYGVEKRGDTFFIMDKEDVGKHPYSDLTIVKTFKVQYANPTDVEAVLKDQVSRYGSIRSMASDSMLIIEDTPESMQRIEALLTQLDRKPKQILMEAKILEITLTESESFGLDWSRLFDGENGQIGVQGLSSPTSPGLFAQFSDGRVTAFLNLLQINGRLRTLSTPTLLAMEDREAETVVGTRIGFKVTTTVNQVTSETVEFLESGIILKVTASVDRNNRILLDIQPEVSAGSVSDDGIPSKTTTQVNTQMLVPDGQTVFMGGLIQRSNTQTREGVPGLQDIPLISGLFSNASETINTTEIVVLLTPRIVDFEVANAEQDTIDRVLDVDRLMENDEKEIVDSISCSYPFMENDDVTALSCNNPVN